MGHTDKRVKLTSEVVAGIKAIKLYSWEEPYQDRILQIREVCCQHKKSCQQQLQQRAQYGLPGLRSLLGRCRCPSG